MAFEIGSFVKSTVSGYKGEVKEHNPEAQTYTVDYKGLGIRRNQPEAQLATASSPRRAAFEPSPRTITHFVDQPDYNDFFDMLQSESHIRVQLPESRLAWFKNHYYSATGEEITDDTPNVSIIRADKQGVSITVNFPAAYRGMVPPIINEWPENATNPNGRRGFCNIAFAFELFSIGFRLGDKHEYQGVGGDRWRGLAAGKPLSA